MKKYISCSPATATIAFMAGALAFSSAVYGNSIEIAQSGATNSGLFVSTDLSRFTPRPAANDTKIDYSYWDKALEYFVFRMGRSSRKSLPSVAPELGTRLIYGHDSALRLEGNRVIFSFLEDDQVSAIIEYRQDLERLADEVDIMSLARNEQLAYWMNLHNVAVIEKISANYPVQQPSRMKIGPLNLPLDEAQFITVNGVALSPKDIRTKIVFPNWNDPRVIYGFFRGEIGGPSILREAFAADKMGTLLDESAFEFVNSLRGVQKRGRTLHVSKIYGEAEEFFFNDWQNDLTGHLQKYSNEEVAILIGKTSAVKATVYEKDVSDLGKGERDPELLYVSSGFDPRGWGFDVGNADTPPIGVPAAVGRLIVEKRKKTRQLLRENGRRGTVIILTPQQLADQDAANREVD